MGWCGVWVVWGGVEWGGVGSHHQGGDGLVVVVVAVVISCDGVDGGGYGYGGWYQDCTVEIPTERSKVYAFIKSRTAVLDQPSTVGSESQLR